MFLITKAKSLTQKKTGKSTGVEIKRGTPGYKVAHEQAVFRSGSENKNPFDLEIPKSYGIKFRYHWIFRLLVFV